MQVDRTAVWTADLEQVNTSYENVSGSKFADDFGVGEARTDYTNGNEDGGIRLTCDSLGTDIDSSGTGDKRVAFTEGFDTLIVAFVERVVTR